MARGVLRASRRPDGRGVYCSGLGADARHPSSDGSWACRAPLPYGACGIRTFCRVPDAARFRVGRGLSRLFERPGARAARSGCCAYRSTA
eukprot:9994-Prymnesium_polylepis.1